jgi:uncharacterized protein YndB with AHSA1/START domain
LDTGAQVTARDGGEGEVRSVRTDRRLRLRWRSANQEQATVIQLTLTPKGDRCTVAFHEERLPDAAVRDERKRHYQELLARLQVEPGA